MQSVGSRLKEAREKKGFSLDEVNARTRINPKNLSAIEHDEVTSISSPFFYRSYVRQYAETVDVDFRALASAVDLLAGHMRQPELPGQGEHQPVRVAPIQARPKRDLSWMIPTAIFLGLVAAGSGGYGLFRHYQPLLHRSAIDRSGKPAASAAATLPVAKTLPTPMVPAAAESIHLKLAATERTWLSVSADGKPAYTGILEAEQTKVLDSHESAKIRTGNAGGVTITFNGRNIGVVGPRGKSRTVVFTRTGYQVQPEGSAPVPANHIGG